MPAPRIKLEGQAKQRNAAKRATIEMFQHKKRAEKEVSVSLPTDGNEKPETVTMLFKAVGFKEYDDLIAANPPTMEQKADGDPFNTDEFAPALLAAVVAEPLMDLAQWKEIWNSDSWSRGELQQLYSNAIAICTKGLDIPFTEND